MNEQRKIYLFMGISEILTGFDSLAESIGTDYLKFLSDSFGEQPVIDLLSKYESILDGDEEVVGAIEAHIMRGDEYSTLAKEIIIVWYTSQYKGPEGELHQGSAENYYNSLIWRVIQAHPPGVSGGAYGHWANSPEMDQ
ncbi:MAG: hypothetical protein JAY94_04470 [Candidatus Thiodiazotropha endolucinida]|nr:hypothetical protein [Candidatus Thiodiazotropha taylori]MCW4316745.1 hypothetical protein [Candidatus Thiodiazotropha taylori]